MRFDAHVRQHAAEDDLANAPLAKLQNQIVRLRSPYLVRADDDRLSILDVGLEPVQPVRARVCKALQCQRSAARETVRLELRSLERPVELPVAIGGIEIVRRDEHT